MVHAMASGLGRDARMLSLTPFYSIGPFVVGNGRLQLVDVGGQGESPDDDLCQRHFLL